MTKKELRKQIDEIREKSVLRRCNSLLECQFCGKDILLGKYYYDRGYGWRIHKKCLDEDYLIGKK